MRRATLRRRRSGAQRAILAAFALVVFIVSGAAAGLTAYFEAATEVAARTALPEESLNAPVAAQISAQDGDDPLAADTAVTEHVAALLPGVPYDVFRSRALGPRNIYRGPDGPPDPQGGAVASLTNAVLVHYQHLPRYADLVEGQWPNDVAPTRPVPVAVHARWAEELGVRVGDLLSVAQRGEAVAMLVTGRFMPREPDSAFWYGELREIEASAETGLLIALDDAGLGHAATTTDSTVTTRWRLAPVLSELRTEDVATLASAVSLLRGRLEGDARLADSRIRLDDSISEILQDIRERLQAAQAVTAVALVLLALASVVSLGLVGRLLAAVREPDTALLRSRGASASLLARWAVREALPVAVVPAALGGMAAWLLLRRLTGVRTDLSPLVLLAVAAATVLAAAMLTVHGVRAAQAAVQSTIERRAQSTRRRAVVRAGSVLLVVAVAAVTVWQLRRYGGPIIDTSGETSTIDPLAAGAPAVALLAGGVLATVAVTGLAWVAARLVGRHRGLTGALTARRLVRRPDTYALPVVLVALAAGAGTLAAGFAGTWVGLQADVAARRTGADLQVSLPLGSTAATQTQIGLQPYRDIPGVERVDPVVKIRRAAFTDDTLTLLATPSDAGDTPPGVELPPGTGFIELEFEAMVRAETAQERVRTLRRAPGAPPAAPVHAIVWVADSDGVVSGLEAERVEVPPDGRRASYRAGTDLPPGSPPWRVVGLELHISPPSPTIVRIPVWIYDYDIEVSGLRTDAGPEELDLDRLDWTMIRLDEGGHLEASGSGVEPPPSGVGLHIDSGGRPWTGQIIVRLIPEQDSRPLPVAATHAALDRFGLAVGDEATLQFLRTAFQVQIVDEVTAVPGTTAAEVMSADLGDLNATLLSSGGRPPAVTQIWIDAAEGVLNDGSAAAATAEVTASVVGADTEVLDRVAIEDDLRGDVFAGVTVVVLWVTAAASVLLAGAGLAAATAASARQRGPEVGVLRSLGFSPGQQAGARLRELALTAVLAVVLGAGAGLLVTYLSAGLLASAVTSSLLEVLHPVLRVSVVPLAGCLGALTAVCLVVTTFHAVRLRRQATARPARDGQT